MPKTSSLRDLDLLAGARWRYQSYIRPYRDVHRSPVTFAARAIRNIRAARADPAIAYVCSDPTNAGDYASHLGLVSLSGLQGVQLFCAPVALNSTFSTLKRRLGRRRSWDAVFVGGGGLLQWCFDEFWAGLLKLDIPLVLFGVGAAESGPSRPVTDSKLLEALGRRATAMHVRDEFTRDLLLRHGARDVTVGICPSVNYLLKRRGTTATATHLLHAIHEPDLRIVGIEPDEMRNALRFVARVAGLEYDEVDHQSGFGPKLLARYDRAALVVSSRLHGCIFSYALGKPFVAVACDRKTVAFVRDYAEEAPCLSPRDICERPEVVLAAAAHPSGSRPEHEAQRNVDIMSGIFRSLSLGTPSGSTAARLPAAADRVRSASLARRAPAEPRVVFDHVWKKFRLGQRHNSLRDLIPALATAVFARREQPVVDQNAFWALKDVSFEVGSGDALGIIGPNGAGKSTTLKLLAKIMKPTRGRREVRGRVGALIELAAGFHPDLTGRENIFMQGAIMGMKRAEIRAKFDDIVDFGGLADFIDTPVKRYSSGMNARLGFAVAAHLDPDVLLIDEVLAVGDFTFQQKCYQRLQEFRRKGVAIVFVSHNLQAIASFCDRALLLRHNMPPLIGDVADVTGAYAAARTTQTNTRAEVVTTRLSREAEMGVLNMPVAPGTRLMFELEIAPAEPLPRCGFGFSIVRSDGLMVFEGMSSLDNVATVDLQPGDTLRCRTAFKANLLRGIYFINGYLIDAQRSWPQLQLGMIGSFVVAEMTRVAGCAELDPRYDLSVTECMSSISQVKVV